MSPPASHPIRLVVTDDLERSRLTVFFRVILVIPHLIWLALWGMVELIVVVLNWFATLWSGRSPAGLHDFLVGYLRYAIHVNAYLFLVANPYPKFYLGSRLAPYPVDLEIDPPSTQHRATVLFRAILIVPAALIAGTAMGGGGTGSGRNLSLGVTPTASFLTWFAALARGRAPRGLRDMAVWGIGYAAQTYGYVFILTDRYPYSGPELFLGGLEQPHVDERVPRLVNADDLRRSRLTVAFRLPLAVVHLVWLLGWTVLALIAGIANWVSVLAIARSPRLLARFLSAYVRYSTHVGAFLFLTGNPFPGFVGAPGSYPVDPRIEPFERQSRWITLFRIVLAFPAMLVAGALSNMLVVAALLAWFASLARGRMPAGLQSAGAYALGYGAQLSAYVLVLTDGYPHASPAAVLEGWGEGPRELPGDDRPPELTAGADSVAEALDG